MAFVARARGDNNRFCGLYVWSANSANAEEGVKYRIADSGEGKNECMSARLSDCIYYLLELEITPHFTNEKFVRASYH